MEKALKVKKKRKITAIILSIMLAAGIPCIVLGATNMDENKAFTALLVLGIICVVGGFYGAPVAWTSMLSVNAEVTLVEAVVNEHLYTVDELSQRLSQKPKQTSALLNDCIRKGYLTGFKREGDTLILNENSALKPKEFVTECKYCGAVVTLTGDMSKCPYCGSPLSAPDKK